MTKVKDITSYLDELFPRDTAESYDNPGLLTGAYDKDVSICVLTLDATIDKAAFARENNASMIITHHPLIFGGISDVCEENISGKILSSLIRSDISVFAAHTNLDKNHGYSNDILAKTLGGDDIIHIDDVECGVAYELKDKTSLGDYCELVKETLGTSGVITYSAPDKKVGKVFVQGGSFDEDVIPYLVDENIDTVVSGEIKHHVMILLEQMGIACLAAGHKATEDVFMTNLAEVLTKKFPEVSFLVSL